MEMEAFEWGSAILEDAPYKEGFEVNPAVMGNGYGSSLSLVLDREKKELVEAPVKLERKGVFTERSIEALKNHSEAERNRRARINAHLDTLRTVIPGAMKMDKASLLAEVIKHLKELKRNASQACEDLMIPEDSDEISVEEHEGGLNGFSYSIRASLCCEYKPGLLSDIRQALDALHLMIMRADIATLGDRMKNVFVIISCNEQNFEDAEYRQFLAGSVHQALRSVLNRFSVSQDFLGTRKRRRISIFSSSLEDLLLFESIFHAYDEGNLTWLAAAEAEAATMSMVRQTIPDAPSVDEANQILRGNWLNAIEQHHILSSGASMIGDILDIGYSVGISTRYLADKFPTAKVSGLDLSPYFLAVAQLKEKRGMPRKFPIRWIHAKGEDTGLPSKSFDLVSIAYVLHECPERAIANLVRESFRLLRPGGTLALTDISVHDIMILTFLCFMLLSQTHIIIGV